jgi:hypothetical protein
LQSRRRSSGVARIVAKVTSTPSRLIASGGDHASNAPGFTILVVRSDPWSQIATARRLEAPPAALQRWRACWRPVPGAGRSAGNARRGAAALALAPGSKMACSMPDVNWAIRPPAHQAWPSRDRWCRARRYVDQKATAHRLRIASRSGQCHAHAGNARPPSGASAWGRWPILDGRPLRLARGAN